MTHRSTIGERREKNLIRFEEALASLSVDEQHTEAMRQAGTLAGGSPLRPSLRDDFGNHAYNAGAFAALAEILLKQAERIEELEKQRNLEGAAQ